MILSNPKHLENRTLCITMKSEKTRRNTIFVKVKDMMIKQQVEAAEAAEAAKG